MADAVTVRTLYTSPSNDYVILHLTCISDGTGESAAIKYAKPSTADRLEIDFCRWAVQGFSSARFLFDHSTDDVAMCLSANGYDDFRGQLDVSASLSSAGGSDAQADPKSAGGTGDLLLTTAGALSGATYDITVGLKVVPK